MSRVLRSLIVACLGAVALTMAAAGAAQAAAQGQAAGCEWEVSEPPEPEGPPGRQIGPMGGFEAYGASATVPSSAEFEGARTLWIRPTFFDGPYRVVVSVVGARSVKRVCDVDPSAERRPVEALRVMAPAGEGPVRWRVEIYESNPDFDARSPPQLMIEGGPEAPAAYRLSSPPTSTVDWISVSPGSEPPCQLTRGPLHRGLRLEAGGPEVRVEDRFEVPQKIKFSAGLRGYARIVAPADMRLRITLLVSAMGGDKAACSLETTGRALAGVYLTVEPRWRNAFDRIWSVEVQQLGDTSPREVSVTGYREHDPLSQGRMEVPSGASTAVCYQSTTFVRFREPTAEDVPFTAARSFRLMLTASGVEVGPQMRSALTEALLEALRAWRSSCQHCRDDGFAVVDIDGELYGLPGLIGSDGLIGNYPPPQRGVISERPDWGKIGGRGTGAKAYDRLNLTPAMRDRICTAPPRPGDIYRAEGTALCREQLAGPETMVINLVLRGGRLNCSPSANVVACWDGSDLIELNLRDYRFYLDGPQTPLFGAGTRLVDLTRVMAHEVGHWHGLGHLGARPSIMSAKFSAAECLDDSTVAALNEIALGTRAPYVGAEFLEYR